MKKHMKRELYTIITQGGIPQRHKGIISTRKKIANLSLLNPQVIPLNPHITE